MGKVIIFGQRAEEKAGYRPGWMFGEVYFEMRVGDRWVPAYAYPKIVGANLYDLFVTKDPTMGKEEEEKTKDIPPVLGELHSVTSREIYAWLGRVGRNFRFENLFEEEGPPAALRSGDPTRFVKA